MKMERHGVITISKSYATHIAPMGNEELKRYQLYLRGNLRAYRRGFCPNMGALWSDLHRRVKEELKMRGMAHSILSAEL